MIWEIFLQQNSLHLQDDNIPELSRRKIESTSFFSSF